MSREFFNNKAEEWDQMVNHNPDKIRRVLSWFPDIKQPTILDVGSGTGVMIPYLKECYGQEAKITAIDFAEKMLEVSKRKHQDYSNLTFIVGDVNTYEFLPEEYDIIICYSVFPHFADKRNTLSRLQKGLATGGRLFIFHSQSRDAINNLHKDAGQEVKEDRLPKAESVAQMGIDLGYVIGRLVDNDEMYVVELVKV